MRSRWWAGWCENAIQQSEEMPGMRACDEEERTDRQGHATVEMPDLPAELDDAAARPQTVFKLNADGVQIKCRTRPPQFDEIQSRTAPESTGDARPAQAGRMVLVNPATHRPAGREAPHGHGRRHVHGPRLAPDHRHRRRKRRSPRLPVVRARGAAPLLPAVGETLPRGEALRLSRAGACRRWAGGAHHEPAGGRRQLGRQERVAQPADCPRSTCSARANGCAT